MNQAQVTQICINTLKAGINLFAELLADARQYWIALNAAGLHTGDIETLGKEIRQAFYAYDAGNLTQSEALSLYANLDEELSTLSAWPAYLQGRDSKAA